MAGGEEEEALAVGAELERDGLGDAGDGGRGEGPALVLRGVEELDLGGAGRGVGRGDRKDAAGGVEGRERPRRPARGGRGARHVHDALARALAQVPQAHRRVQARAHERVRRRRHAQRQHPVPVAPEVAQIRVVVQRQVPDRLCVCARVRGRVSEKSAGKT